MARAKRKLYNDYADILAGRIERRLQEMFAHHQFEYGTEFEIALCQLLRSILPGRCGICRGYIVPERGETEGDDIIVYDAFRYPTLRALGQELGLKEYVPADAVLAYIEVKRTLYARPAAAAPAKVTQKQEKAGGQSIEKALNQVRKVKLLSRTSVPLSTLVPGVDLNIKGTVTGGRAGDAEIPAFELKMELSTPLGYPKIRNPWFTMVVAQNLSVGRNAPMRATLFEAVEAYARSNPSPGDALQPTLPDVIAAGPIFIFPVLSATSSAAPSTPGDLQARWFLTKETELAAIESRISPIAMSFLHMFSAIETMLLASLPVGKVLQEAIDPDMAIPWQKGTAPVR